MSIEYKTISAYGSYDHYSDVRPSRDIVEQLGQYLIDAGWTTHLNAFKNTNYTSYSNNFGLVLKSPDNLYSIGFRGTGSSGNGSLNINIYLYTIANTPSTVDEITSNPSLAYVSAAAWSHPISGLYCINVGLVSLRSGGFLLYMTRAPFSITDGVDRWCVGVLPALHCQSGTTINCICVTNIAYNTGLNIFSSRGYYCTGGVYSSNVLSYTSSSYSFCGLASSSNYEIMLPLVSDYGAFIAKDFYRCKKNNNTITKGQTILLDNQQYIVVYTDSSVILLFAL